MTLRPAHKFPTALTVLPTYQCTAACENCCFGCTPIIKGRIPQSRLLQYLQQAIEIDSLRLVVFSGGECFLLGDDLDEAIECVSTPNILVRCVTNGYWAETLKGARQRLCELAAKGLDELNISTGDFHRKWVPVEHVANAAEAAVLEGLSAVVMIEISEGRQTDEATFRELSAIKRIYEDKVLRRRLQIVESPWMSNSTERQVPQDRDMQIGRDEATSSGGCTSVLSTIVISPSEHLIACCGLAHEQIPDMRLGSLRDNSIADLLGRARRDFLKQWIMLEGPHEILKWASEIDPNIEWEHQYSHICDACRRVHSDQRVLDVIGAHGSEKAYDMLFRFNMLDTYNPSEPTALQPCERQLPRVDRLGSSGSKEGGMKRW